ncbi:MAG: ABC transporter ATP-binding protein [Veillonella parvula]|nr:ABC transporter ATP-binding protein [Veillonella parvula]
MSVLTVDNITVGYGKRLILENQSIVFDKPEIISIIGPNGSGKSTFLKALARLIKLKLSSWFDPDEIRMYRFLRNYLMRI